MSKCCRVCGKENPNEKWAFCSEECKERYDSGHPHIVTCEYCGKEFLLPIRMGGTYHKRLFCSDECSKLSYREKTKFKKSTCILCGKEIVLERDEKTNRFPRLEVQFCDSCKKSHTAYADNERICRYCGKKFKPSSASAFCSKDCYIKHSNVQSYGAEQPTGVCKFCGKKFLLPRDKNGRYNINAMFCSKECGTRQYFKENPLPDRYCAICGKLLVLKKGEDIGNFRRRKYCDNPECRREGHVANFMQTCMQKYGVPFACFLQKANEGSRKISKTNQDFAVVLSEVGLETELDTITFGIYSYDIWIKGTNILLEINPTYTHNVYGSHFNNWTYDERLKTRHLDKVRVAQENGYRCIHVWQWDDTNKIIQLILPKEKIYARKLTVKSISRDNANIFIDFRHLQGACYGNKVNLGLFDDDGSLIQVMAFGKPRYNKNYQWELLRLCTLNDKFVVGGAERLFKHFVQEYNPESVISYCDVSKFTGDVYPRLGFTLEKQTAPSKVWSKGPHYITDNLLRQRGADQLIGTRDGKGTDNEEIMLREGWLPVYDCGQKVFVWKKED